MGGTLALRLVLDTGLPTSSVGHDMSPALKTSAPLMRCDQVAATRALSKLRSMPRQSSDRSGSMRSHTSCLLAGAARRHQVEAGVDPNRSPSDESPVQGREIYLYCPTEACAPQTRIRTGDWTTQHRRETGDGAKASRTGHEAGDRSGPRNKSSSLLCDPAEARIGDREDQREDGQHDAAQHQGERSVGELGE